MQNYETCSIVKSSSEVPSSVPSLDETTEIYENSVKLKYTFLQESSDFHATLKSKRIKIVPKIAINLLNFFGLAY
jgi:hypothetical protein